MASILFVKRTNALRSRHILNYLKEDITFFIIKIEGEYENTVISSKYVLNIELERRLSDLNILINAHNQIRNFIHDSPSIIFKEILYN